MKNIEPVVMGQKYYAFSYVPLWYVMDNTGNKMYHNCPSSLLDYIPTLHYNIQERLIMLRDFFVRIGIKSWLCGIIYQACNWMSVSEGIEYTMMIDILILRCSHVWPFLFVVYDRVFLLIFDLNFQF